MNNLRLPSPANPLELTERQFTAICRLVHGQCGVNLKGKRELVKARLAKRLRSLGMTDFGQYLELVGRDASGGELNTLIDALTTNKTGFFRENQHFDFLRRKVLPGLQADEARLWSAGCSSGEEAYSLAILVSEALETDTLRRARILATDISTRMVARARRATYTAEELRGLQPHYREGYFRKVADQPHPAYQVRENVRTLVSVGRLNLVDHWPMKGPFDVVFCRNVMIYFDKETQHQLVHRLREILKPGGLLFVGHSESLAGLGAELRYIRPAVYQR